MLQSRQDGNGYTTIKLDLEKAYDQLEWDFIKETLEFFQLPTNLITLIMNMISSTSFHILWNGVPLPEVVPTRGVRQGDLLPPIFLSFVWKDCRSGWKRLLEIDLSTLFPSEVRYVSHICFSPMTSFFSPKPWLGITNIYIKSFTPFVPLRIK